VCLKDPGFDVDLTVRCDLVVFVRLYLGHASWQEALDKGLWIEGDKRMVPEFPIWLQLHKQLGRDYLPFVRPAA